MFLTPLFYLKLTAQALFTASPLLNSLPLPLCPTPFHKLFSHLPKANPPKGKEGALLHQNNAPSPHQKFKIHFSTCKFVTKRSLYLNKRMGSFSVMHSFSQNLIRAKQYKYKGKLEKKRLHQNRLLNFPVLISNARISLIYPVNEALHFTGGPQVLQEMQRWKRAGLWHQEQRSHQANKGMSPNILPRSTQLPAKAQMTSTTVVLRRNTAFLPEWPGRPQRTGGTLYGN